MEELRPICEVNGKDYESVIKEIQNINTNWKKKYKLSHIDLVSNGKYSDGQMKYNGDYNTYEKNLMDGLKKKLKSQRSRKGNPNIGKLNKTPLKVDKPKS